MARHDHDDDWIDEVQHREDFVLDEHLNGMADSDHDVVYRRANLATEFVTSARFESLNEAMFEPAPDGKVSFTASPASLRDLDDDDSAMNGVFEPVQQKTAGFFSAPSVFDSSFSSSSPGEFMIPTGEVPDALETEYHQVNPMFESRQTAATVFETLQQSLKSRDIDFKCSADWSIQAFAVVAAEELHFRIELHRLAMKSTIRVDFNLYSGDEMRFVGTTDMIRKDCRSIDECMQAFPDLSFDLLMDDWSGCGELFPNVSSPPPPNYEELSGVLADIITESRPFARYEVAKRLKELCETELVRRAFSEASLRSEFVRGLQAMLKDADEDIVRFGIYTILNFREDLTILKGLELPSLPETLQEISSLSQKPSTRKLAGDLFNTLQAVC